MRFHRDWSIAQPWCQARGMGELFAPQNLIAAKMEPMTRRDLPGIMLQLRLERGESVLSVPCIYVDESALLTKLRDILIWPEAVTRITTDAKLAELEAVLYPWIESVVAGQGADTVYEYIFDRGEAAECYAEACAEGLFAAVPLAETRTALLLAQYASRFVAGVHLAASNEMLNAAALITPYAQSIQCVDLSPKTRRIAERWFGRSMESGAQAGAPISLYLGNSVPPELQCADDIRIIRTDPHGEGKVLTYLPPLIMDDLVRLGENRVGTSLLRIHAPERPYVRRIADPPEAFGGSHGRIVFIVRRDAAEVPGADVDEANALSTALQAEGFSIETLAGCNPERLNHVGIIHAFGLHDPESVNIALQYAKSNGIPFVVSAHFEDAAHRGRWGMHASRSLLGSCSDENELERTLTKLADKQVEIDGVTAQSRVDDGFDGLRREILRRAEIVIVQSRAEYDAVQRFSGRRRRMIEVAPMVHTFAPAASVGHLVPDLPYVLVHDSLDARHNLGLVMRALRLLELPTVMIAPYVDRRLARMVQALSRNGCAILPEASAGECEAIYARAAVYVDAAWIGDGLYRILQAAARGMHLALADLRLIPAFLEPRVARCDPSSVRSIQTAIAQAWQNAVGQDALPMPDVNEEWRNPSMMLRACVQVYAQAGEHLRELASHR